MKVIAGQGWLPLKLLGEARFIVWQEAWEPVPVFGEGWDFEWKGSIL